MGGAAQTAQSVRLFMVPGMNHCGGGEGPNVFNMVSALERWVEDGKAPDQILASHLTGRKGGPHAAAVSVSANGSI